MGHTKSFKLRGRTISFSIYDFIEAVRAQALLWDRNHPSYNNRDKRESSWLAVARHLNIPLEESEKHRAVLLLTKRWKNTRDSFLRSQRRFPDDERDPKTYVYQQELSFLLPDQPDEPAAPTDSPSDDVKAVVPLDPIESVLTDGGDAIATPEDPQPKALAAETPAKVERKAAGARRVSARKRRLPAALRPWSKKAKASARLASPDPLDPLDDDDDDDVGVEPKEAGDGGVANSTASASAAAATAPSESDPDQSFFDSIKPVVRGMSVEQKLDFQIEILKLLKDFRSRM